MKFYIFIFEILDY